MNMSKFSPMYGAPIWDECVGGKSGDFNEDWRLMNCLNFVYKPQGFASRPEMDALYNAQVRRFYDSEGYRRRFARRLWQHRWSLWHVLKNLPRTIQAARYFSASKADLERACNDIEPHPRQPRGLTPHLSPDLTPDALAALSNIQRSPGIDGRTAPR
jgi:magnesium-protoporphyrin IX monomethyl ester (oxidative) cyclase